MITTVTIDTREHDRIHSAKNYYTKQGLTVKIAELPIGDYIFSDGNDKVVFEFKLVSDFISSIQDGRVFNQAISQSEEFNHHFVIIHGDLQTRSKYLAMSRSYRPVTVFQYIGAIASINRYSTVIESYSPYIDESYYRMMTQANKCLQDKPQVKRFPKKHKNTALNFLCYSVYGINYKKGKQIVDTYQLQSLNDLMKLTHNDLTNIDGIGDKTAKSIMEAIHGKQ